MRRFIAGLILGIEEYKIKIVPNEEVDTLLNPCKEYIKYHKDGTPLAL
jgi:hypothetical protein